MKSFVQITSSISLEEFTLLTQPLIGLPITRPWRGIGSTLLLEIGALRGKYKSGKPRGEAGVEIEWSWRVETPRTIKFGSWCAEQKINRGISELEGHVIEEITFTNRLPELSIRLSGNKWIQSFTTAEGQPDWSIFLPDGSWLTVRRGCVVREEQT